MLSLSFIFLFLFIPVTLISSDDTVPADTVSDQKVAAEAPKSDASVKKDQQVDDDDDSDESSSQDSDSNDDSEAEQKSAPSPVDSSDDDIDDDVPDASDQENTLPKKQEGPTRVAPDSPEDQENTDDEADDSISPKMREVVPLEDIPSPEDEEEGITTVDLQEPSGNWLYKRIWWEKAEARYDKIKTTVNGILDSRMYFFEKRVNLDRTLFDPFYMSLGLTRGELQEAVAYLVEQLENTPESGEKKLPKKALINTLQAEQKNVEQLQSSVETIRKIDHAVDDALTQLMNQINLCRNYEQEAWQYLRSIAQELSDKAARDHYYAMDTLWSNVKQVKKYIEEDFTTHFEELSSEAKKQTENINQSISQLKEKGIDLKNMVQSMLEKEDAEPDDDDADEDDQEPESVGWFSWIVGVLLWPFYKIADLWRSLFG